MRARPDTKELPESPTLREFPKQLGLGCGCDTQSTDPVVALTDHVVAAFLADVEQHLLIDVAAKRPARGYLRPDQPTPTTPDGADSLERHRRWLARLPQPVRDRPIIDPRPDREIRRGINHRAGDRVGAGRVAVGAAMRASLGVIDTEVEQLLRGDELLTRAQEHALAKIRDEQPDLHDRVIDRFVRSNKGLVYAHINKTAKKHQQIHADDLEHAGLVGVAEAARRFDHTRGFKFSTYAVPWIQKYVHVAVEEHYDQGAVHIPTAQRRAVTGWQHDTPTEHEQAADRWMRRTVRLGTATPSGARATLDATQVADPDGSAEDQWFVLEAVKERLAS